MEKKKQLIFNSDDFGLTTDVNGAIYEGFKNGLLTSTCIMTNGEAFEDAIKNYLPKMSGCGFGVHLNIIEGKTHNDFHRKSMLFDKYGRFNNGFILILIKSYNKKFMEEVEFEFRTQIDRLLLYVKPDHLNSHVHVHAIPRIFALTCKLAKEYNIPYVRTQYEHFYFVPDIKKYLSPKFYINIIKLMLLNFFTVLNQKALKKYNIKTNNYFNGVLYTGGMDKNTIKYGILKSISAKKEFTEIIVHPSMQKELNNNFKEYLTVMDDELIQYIKKLNIEITNYTKLA